MWAFIESLGDNQLWIIAAVGLTGTVIAFWLGRITANQSPSEESAPVFSSDVDPFTVGSAMEKRGVARRGGNPVEIYVAQADKVHPPLQAWVKDRSAGGLRICVASEIPVGTILRARPRKAPPGAPWVELEVKSCSPDGQEWALGCAYLQAPAWSVQLLFG